MKRFFVGGLLALAAVGCAGSNSDHDVEGALKGGRVAGVGALSATSAECDSGAAVMVGEREGRLYECNVETRGRTMRLSCGMFDDDDVAYCSELGPEPGAPVFTTAEERAAPKAVTWKCEDVDEEGREIGPAFVSIKDAPPGSPVEEHDWMTQADARRLASRLGAAFGVDC